MKYHRTGTKYPEIPDFEGAMVKFLAEYAASIGKRLVVEKHGNSTIYRMVRVGAP